VALWPWRLARQLIESGETVGLVALIEIYNVRSMRWPRPLYKRLINRFVLNPYFHFQNVFAAEGTGWARLRYRLLPDPAAATPHAKIADVYEEALAQYDVRPYPGELTVFLADRHLAGYHDRLGGWGEVAQGGVRLFSLPISPRGSLVEPYVGRLAPILRDCLDRAIENSKGDLQEPSLEFVSTH
jgi:thioesterase domain-containing protein